VAGPKLIVVQGSWIASSKWLNFPATVKAPSPFSRGELCEFRIGREDAVKQARAHRRQPVLDLWSCILGEPPPVPNVMRYIERPYDGLTSFSMAHACFRGIRRPCGEDADGENILAYVLKPTSSYEYVPNLVCVVAKSAVAADLVFVAYVKLDHPCVPEGHLVKGVLTHWQFVEADEGAAFSLPIDYESRYRERLW